MVAATATIVGALILFVPCVIELGALIEVFILAIVLAWLGIDVVADCKEDCKFDIEEASETLAANALDTLVPAHSEDPFVLDIFQPIVLLKILCE